MLWQDQDSCSHSECRAIPASGRAVSARTQPSRVPSSPTYQLFNHSSRCTAHAKSSTVEDIHGNLWRNRWGLGHAGHCFLLQYSLDFTPHWDTLPVLGSALTSATTALSIPRKMLQNWAFPDTYYIQFCIWLVTWSSDSEIISIPIT